jgi:transcriptional regulator with PAS, ATPase and Fis domain
MSLVRVTNSVDRVKTAGGTRLRVVYGDGAGIELGLPAAGVVLGGSPTCDVVLRDPTVSGRHASVIPSAEGFDVKDLGSRNGTWLDGVAVTHARVPAGAVLRIGSTIVQLLPSEESLDLPPSAATSFGAMLGQSLAMRKVYAVLERASTSTAPVLLLGESGTGKELAARAVHDHSTRRDGPFVVFDCGAASDTLIESELFGYKRGAFTGAHADRPGAFALAANGTLFLDEIGDLPSPLQPKLLRLLERGEVTPLGGRKSERFDVRIVAATHRDLFREVAIGSFRGDLYYRLAVVEVNLPPLRQRPDDLPTLIEIFLRSCGSQASDISGAALATLQRYAWPGNVRELRNVIARAVALSAAGTALNKMPILLRSQTAAPPPDVRLDLPYSDAKELVTNRFEQEYLTALLRRADGNLSQAARLAGLERKHLYKVLARAGLLPTRAAEDDDA